MLKNFYENWFKNLKENNHKLKLSKIDNINKKLSKIDQEKEENLKLLRRTEHIIDSQQYTKETVEKKIK